MNPFSQTRILLMYLILISEGWTWGRPLPSPPPTPCLPSQPLSPSSLLGSAHVSRAEISPLSLPPYFPKYSSLPPPASLSIFSPSHPSSPLATPFYPVCSLLNASVILNVGLQLEMRVPASEQWREKNSGTQWDRTRDLYKTKSLYALPTELFRPMRVTGFNLYLYIMTAFSSLRWCVIQMYILLFRFNIKYEHWWKLGKYVFTSTYTRPYRLFIINCDTYIKQLFKKIVYVLSYM